MALPITHCNNHFLQFILLLLASYFVHAQTSKNSCYPENHCCLRYVSETSNRTHYLECKGPDPSVSYQGGHPAPTLNCTKEPNPDGALLLCEPRGPGVYTCMCRGIYLTPPVMVPEAPWSKRKNMLRRVRRSHQSMIDTERQIQEDWDRRNKRAEGRSKKAALGMAIFLGVGAVLGLGLSGLWCGRCCWQFCRSRCKGRRQESTADPQKSTKHDKYELASGNPRSSYDHIDKFPYEGLLTVESVLTGGLDVTESTFSSEGTPADD